MINLTPEAGKVKRSSEPLSTLAGYRRVKVFNCRQPWLASLIDRLLHDFNRVIISFGVSGEDNFWHIAEV